MSHSSAGAPRIPDAAPGGRAEEEDRRAVLACEACPRLVALRAERAARAPEHHNRPVPPSGEPDAPLLILGLAPGPLGANRTGRPFEGDRSGDLLFRALFKLGLAERPDGGPRGVRIDNALRCLPPDNRPTALELRCCRERFLAPALARSPAIALLALGRTAHEATLAILGGRLSDLPFCHGSVRPISGRWLVNSYHPSPRNLATGRLAPGEVERVLRLAAAAAGLIPRD